MSVSEQTLSSPGIPPEKSGAAVIFFDGVCGLCNRFVNFLLKRDRKQQFLFAPLQGSTAEMILSAEDRQQLNTVVLWDGSQAFRHSSAVVRILWRIGGVWRLAGSLLWLIPKPLRDQGYHLVSKYRYRLFGKHESCRMPTAEERERFLG